MTKSRAVHYLLCFALLFAIVSGLAGNRVVQAAQQSSNGSFSLPPNQEQPSPEDKLELKCKLPVVTGKSGESFEFEVELKYEGSERRRFDLTVTVPPDWRSVIVSGYPEKQIAAIEIAPPVALGYPTTERITVGFAPLPWKPPEPGEYVVTLEATSEDIKESIELKAKVTAIYSFEMITATGKLNTEATAGEDTPLSIVLVNTGTAAIENITFSSTKPEGWSVTFSPKKVDSLEPGLTQEVNVVIKPPRGKTIAGDYAIFLRAESKDYLPDPLRIRVTVLTPAIWGWVGIIIVVVVIAGLGVLFWRLGRR